MPVLLMFLSTLVNLSTAITLAWVITTASTYPFS